MNLKRLAIFTTLPVAVMLITMWVRPIWRDEIWAMYFSSPELPFADIIQRQKYDTHPPLYFWILHYWRMIADSVMWMKALNLVFIVLGVLSIWQLGKTQRRETILFLILCAGSYWVIYFAAEIRPYTLLFILSSVSVFLLQAVLNERRHFMILSVLWCVVGAILCMSHYYGALWIGLSGGLCALAFLHQRHYGKFILWGTTTAVALIPVSLWIWASLDTINFTEDPTDGLVNFKNGLTQFSRGITDKTMGSNFAFALLAILGLKSLLKTQKMIDKVLIVSSGLLVITIFTLHVVATPIIKERAFIVIIPALLLLAARSIIENEEQQSLWRDRARRIAPYLILIMPILFLVEFTKDREKLSDVRAAIHKAPGCEASSIPTFFRYSPQGDNFASVYANWTLKPMGNRAPNLVDVEQATAPWPETECQIKAIALGLPRGDKVGHDIAMRAFENGGIDVSTLERHNLAQGRHILLKSAD